MELKRIAGNPVLSPDPEHPWEARNVFNCGVHQWDGKVVLIYRGQGWENDISHLGYAESDDGVHFSRRAEPVFSPVGPDERNGVEDPRITQLDGRVHMLYTAWSPEAIQVGHASTTDFLSWERHGIAFAGPDNKDAAIFPAMSAGRYAAFHRLPPSLWIAFSDDLKEWGDFREIMSPRHGCYDSLKLGAGGPPIETELGWLVIYHGVDRDHVYRLGVALLDRDDPSKVLNRPSMPILQPEEPWERDGEVPNVVFSCGTAERGDDYYVYYGGADRVIGLATASKGALLDFAAHGN